MTVPQFELLTVLRCRHCDSEDRPVQKLPDDGQVCAACCRPIMRLSPIEEYLSRNAQAAVLNAVTPTSGATEAGVINPDQEIRTMTHPTSKKAPGMTPEQFNEIEARAKKATPGPWTSDVLALVDTVHRLRAALAREDHLRFQVEELLDQVVDTPGDYVDDVRTVVERLQQAELAAQLHKDAIERAKELHREHRLYTDCGHQHSKGDPGVQSVDWVGLVCEDGYIGSICRACCAGDGDGQTEICAADHSRQCWPCPTAVALVLDGSEPADGGTEK